MKSVFFVATLALAAISSLAHAADSVDAIVIRAAIAEVNKQIYTHQSPLNESHSKMLSHFRDSGAPRAMVMSSLASKTEIDSTVMVSVPYATISAVSEMGTLNVTVKVTISVDENTSDVKDTKAVTDGKSIRMSTELPD